MPETICTRLEFKWVLHQSTHNYLLEMITLLCLEIFSVTMVIKIKCKYTYLCESFCAAVDDCE